MTNPFLAIIADDAPNWRGEALCAEVDTDIFFPDKGGSSREAKQICGRCTVSDQCLDFALRNGERFGIWGGVSERDRRRLSQELGLTRARPWVHGTAAGYARHRRDGSPACRPCIDAHTRFRNGATA